MTSTMLTMFYVDWSLPKKQGKPVEDGPRVPRIMSRRITIQERTSAWQSKPMDTYDSFEDAAANGWYPSEQACLDAELRDLRAEAGECARREHLVVAMRPKVARRARKKGP